MKKSRLPSQSAKNVSKLHERILNLLTSEESPFKGYEIRQEHRVSDINPNYHSNREKFDLVIIGLNIVIEIHGQQHYEPVTFGGIDIEEAKRRFARRIAIDEQKKKAAEEASWSYVVIPYTEQKISIKELTDLIYEAIQKPANKKHEPKKMKSKIKGGSFAKTKVGYKWPTKKIQN